MASAYEEDLAWHQLMRKIWYGISLRGRSGMASAYEEDLAWHQLTRKIWHGISLRGRSGMASAYAEELTSEYLMEFYVNILEYYSLLPYLISWSITGSCRL